MRRRIVIDTDPGIDDAVAILLALAAPEELDVLGIIAVAGNLPLILTERNARRVCELAGRADVPVYAGCSRPLLRPLATAEHVHGETARDRLLLPEPTMAATAHRFSREAPPVTGCCYPNRQWRCGPSMGWTF